MSDTPSPPASPRVARLPSGSGAHDVVVLRRVELWFQKSPGIAGTDHREIRDLRYRLRREGTVVQGGRVANDGKIVFRAPPGGTIVDLLVNNRAVASYEVTLSDQALPAATADEGQQRRLRMLGYHLGHSGPSGDGVDGSVGSRSERAILDYQADKGYGILGNADATTRNGLTSDVVT